MKRENHEELKVTVDSIRVHASDGYEITSLRYRAHADASARVVIAPATGVPQRFYARFAKFLALQGFEVWSVDYRGIGLSKPATLKGFNADFVDWAQRDFRAVVDAIPDDLPLLHVGHSIGCHILGMSEVAHRFSASWMFACGTGWSGWMKPLERVKVNVLWNVAMPLMVAWKGYLNWSLVGMGDDLPLGVYKQWKHWCSLKYFFAADPAHTKLVQASLSVTIPIFAYTADDDSWAPASSREAMLGAAYSNAMVRRFDLDTRERGPIGHIGYFRPEQHKLWFEVSSQMKSFTDV